MAIPMKTIRSLFLLALLMPELAWGTSSSVAPYFPPAISLTTITANAAVGTLPPNATVIYAVARETAGNAVVISLGTTLNGIDVAPNIALQANKSTIIPIAAFSEAWWSNTLTQTIYASSTNWNNSGINIKIYYMVGL